MHGMIHGTWRIHNHINYIIWYVSNGSSSRLSGMHSCFLLIFEMLWIPGQPNIQVKKSSDPGDLINLCLLTCIQLRCNLRINNQEALDHWMSTFGPRDLSYRFCLGWVGWVGWPFVRSMVNCQVGLSPRAKKNLASAAAGSRGPSEASHKLFKLRSLANLGRCPAERTMIQVVRDQQTCALEVHL